MESRENESISKIRSEREKWEREHEAEFAKERKETFLSLSGIPIKRIYTPEDLQEKEFDYLKDLGFPGDNPYTRGISATGYRSALWRMSQAAALGTPEECNELWKGQFAAGLNQLQIQYDLPTQYGLDPDDPRTEGEVGRVGVSMFSLRDWETAFEGIDFSKISVSQVSSATASIATACYLALAERRGYNLSQLRGACQNDILKEYVARGVYIFPPKPSLRLAIDVISYCVQLGMEYFNPIQVMTYQYVERGATPVHEIALGLAAAFTYLSSVAKRGLNVESIAPSVQIVPAYYHTGFFEQIAKLRALRKIYTRILKEQFRVKNPKAMKVNLFSSFGGREIYRQQYLNNIARNAIGGLAAALAGSQVIALRPYDEMFGIPTDESITNAIRTQQVIAYETDIADVVDPLAGSYFVEWLTSEIEERVLKELKVIEDVGGFVKCIEEGYIAQQLAKDAYEWEKKFQRKEILRVGVNIFTTEEEEEKPARICRGDPKVEQLRIKALNELRKNRDDLAVNRALQAVKKAAATESSPSNNMMVPIIEAVKAYATYGEICDILRGVWGEFTAPKVT
ncbi:methylmalonyl-CoA mutase family protein [Chloroflexota bacterium]